MSRACPKPQEEVCSIKLPVAKNPRRNPWIDHINKEAKRLKISYMSAVGDKRVRESYKIKKNREEFREQKGGRIKAKDRKKGLGKKGDLDKELESLEEEELLDQPLVRKAPKAKAKPKSAPKAKAKPKSPPAKAKPKSPSEAKAKAKPKSPPAKRGLSRPFSISSAQMKELLGE
jgi:hypothetical protein